jgi:hypothetical protein
MTRFPGLSLSMDFPSGRLEGGHGANAGRNAVIPAEQKLTAEADTRPVIRVKVGAINEAVRAGAKVLADTLFLLATLAPSDDL